MVFSHLLGNDSVKNYLSRILDRGAVGNSYLFTGPSGVGKGLFAKAFAKSLLAGGSPSKAAKVEAGNHPDLHLYRPEGKTGTHPIETLREFSEQVYIFPHEASRKVFIIEDAERMLPVSANALLKTFEEPSSDSTIILVSSAVEALLPTILSRCSKVVFSPIGESLLVDHLQSRFTLPLEQARLFARLSQGSLTLAEGWALKGMDPNRERLLLFLRQGRTNYGILRDVVGDLSQQLEKRKQELIAQLEEEQLRRCGRMEELLAVHRATLAKEVEGAVALAMGRECAFLFTTVLYWFRDAHLLREGGEVEQLFNLDMADHLPRQGELPSLEFVEKQIADAQLALARSSSLQASLEAFFLSLQ